MARDYPHLAIKPEAAISLEEFLDFVRQPYSQPTIAALLDDWFGYSIAGAHHTTEVVTATGDRIDLGRLYQAIQSSAPHRVGLADAAIRLRK